jgi:hypothetical protein
MSLRRPSHATVIAYLALFIAVASGTAIAAKKIGPSGLKKNAVTAKKIASEAVTTAKLKDDAVTGAKLDNGAVGEGKIDADAVTANKLAPNSVGTNKIRDEAVESAKIPNGAITEGKIGNNAVIGSKVADGSLGPAEVAQVVANVVFTPPPSLPVGECENSGELTIPGLQAADDVLVLPADGGAGWTSGLFLEGYGPTGGGGVRVRVCNRSGGALANPVAPLLVLGFR